MSGILDIHVISWMILQNDPRNENAMEPLAVLSGYGQKRGPFDIPMEDIERLKVELKPLIAMATIGFLPLFCIALGGFFLTSKDIPVTLSSVILFIFWSIVVGVVSDQNNIRPWEMIVTLVTMSKFYKVILRNDHAQSTTEHGRNVEEEERNIEEKKEMETFLRQMESCVRVVDSLRDCNQFLKSIIGSDFLLTISFATLGTYAVIADGETVNARIDHTPFGINF